MFAAVLFAKFVKAADPTVGSCTVYKTKDDFFADKDVYHTKISLQASVPLCLHADSGFFILAASSDDQDKITIVGKNDDQGNTDISSVAKAIGAAPKRDKTAYFSITSTGDQDVTLFYDFAPSYTDGNDVYNEYIILKSKQFSGRATSVKYTNGETVKTVTTVVNALYPFYATMRVSSIDGTKATIDDMDASTFTEKFLWLFHEPVDTSAKDYYLATDFIINYPADTHIWIDKVFKLTEGTVLAYTTSDVLTQGMLEQYDEKCNTIRENDYFSSQYSLCTKGFDTKLYLFGNKEVFHEKRQIQPGEPLCFVGESGMFAIAELASKQQKITIVGVNSDGTEIISKSNGIGAAPKTGKSAYFLIKSSESNNIVFYYDFTPSYEETKTENGITTKKIYNEYIVMKNREFSGRSIKVLKTSEKEVVEVTTVICALNPACSTMTVTSNSDTQATIDSIDSNTYSEKYLWLYLDPKNSSSDNYYLTADFIITSNGNNVVNGIAELKPGEVLAYNDDGFKSNYIKQYDENGKLIEVGTCKEFKAKNDYFAHEEVFHYTWKANDDEVFCFRADSGFFIISNNGKTKQEKISMEGKSTNGTVIATKSKIIGAAPYLGGSTYFSIVFAEAQEVTLFYDYSPSYEETIEEDGITTTRKYNEYIIFKKEFSGNSTSLKKVKDNKALEYTTVINVVNPLYSHMNILSANEETSATIESYNAEYYTEQFMWIYLEPKDSSSENYYLSASFKVTAEEVPENWIDKVIQLTPGEIVTLDSAKNVDIVTFENEEIADNDPSNQNNGETDEGLPAGIIALIVICCVIVVCGIGLFVFFKFFKNNSDAPQV